MSEDSWIDSMNEDSMYVVKLDSKSYILGGYHPGSGVVNVYRIQKFPVFHSNKNSVVEYRYNDRVREEEAKNILQGLFEDFQDISKTVESLEHDKKWLVKESVDIGKDDFKNYLRTCEELLLPENGE